MAKLTRKTAKVFGATATTTGDNPQIGQFGSAKVGTYIGTNDIDTIQGLSAWSNGWIDAVTPTQQFPTLPEMTGVHNVLSYQIAYTLQEGIAEWDSGTTYYTGSFAKGSDGTIYRSLADDNTNNAVTDVSKWAVHLPTPSGNLGKAIVSDGTNASYQSINLSTTTPFSVNTGNVDNDGNGDLIYAPQSGQAWISWQNPAMTSLSQDGYTVTYSNGFRQYTGEKLYGWFADYNGTDYAFYNRNVGLPVWQKLTCPAGKTLRMTGFYMPRAQVSSLDTNSIDIKLYKNNVEVFSQTYSMSYGQYNAINNIEFDAIYVGSSGVGSNIDWGGSYPLKFIGEEYASTATSAHFKVGGEYPNIKATPANNQPQFERGVLQPISFSGGSVEVPWTQPVLTSAGTYGQGELSVKSVDGTEWKAFDNNYSTYYQASPDEGWTMYWYTAKALKYQQLVFNFLGNDYKASGIAVYGSNDDSTWVQIGTGGGGGTTQTINITNQNTWHYIKLVTTGVYVDVADYTNISITATHIVSAIDGTHNIFVGSTGNPYALKNTIYRQKAEPAPINATKVGSPAVNNGVAGSFNSSNYYTLSTSFNPQSHPWEIQFKVKLTDLNGNNFFSRYMNTYFGIDFAVNSSKLWLAVSFNGTSQGVSISSTNNLTTNRDYLLKAEFTGSAYNIYIDGNLEGTASSTSTMVDNTNTTYIGIANYAGGSGLQNPLKGTIDFRESYIKINQELWWSGVQIPTNDVWLNTSKEPLTAYKYNGTTWQEFNDVPLGSLTVLNGAISSVETIKFNYTQTRLTSSLPSNRFIDLTLGANGSQYIAPANGWFTMYSWFTGNQITTLYNVSQTIGNSTNATGTTFGYCSIPVKKDDVVTFDSNASTKTLKFIYAESEV